MDKKARAQADEAEEAKQKAYEELGLIRTAVREKKMAEARKQAEELREKERAGIEKVSVELRRKNEAAKAEMEAVYNKNREKWVEDIFRRAVQQ